MRVRMGFIIGEMVLATCLIAVGLYLCRPAWIITLLAKASPEVIYCAQTNERVVALTIDDGPDEVTTPEMLDLLRRHEAHATFFLFTSRVAGNEDLVAEALKDNHELGNHLATDKPSILLDPADFERQLMESHATLGQFAQVRLFRPGSGWYNARMLAILAKHGYRCVLGSLYPFDPQTRSASFAASYVLGNVRPGSVIVLHDHGARGRRTTAALTLILPELRRRGYRVLTVSELLSYSGD